MNIRQMNREMPKYRGATALIGMRGREAVGENYVGRFVRLAPGFWSGPTRARAWLLTIGVLVGFLSTLSVAVAVNKWSRFFFDALQNDDGGSCRLRSRLCCSSLPRSCSRP